MYCCFVFYKCTELHRENVIVKPSVTLGYLLNWTLTVYGTASDPLQNNTHAGGRFPNSTTPRKFC